MEGGMKNRLYENIQNVQWKPYTKETIVYPTKEGGVEERDIFILECSDGGDLFTLSLKHLDEATKEKLLSATKTIKEIVNENTKTCFRRFKLSKIKGVVPGEDTTYFEPDN